MFASYAVIFFLFAYWFNVNERYVKLDIYYFIEWTGSVGCDEHYIMWGDFYYSMFVLLSF